MFLLLAKWEPPLPVSKQDCLFEAAVTDMETNLAFAYCLFNNGGIQCLEDIPAGSECLKKVLKNVVTK